MKFDSRVINLGNHSELSIPAHLHNTIPENQRDRVVSCSAVAKNLPRLITAADRLPT